MNEGIIENYIQQIEVGEVQRHGNLEVYPLLAPSEHSTGPGLIMADEAIETGALEITEVDSYGEVQALLVRNTSRSYVLLIAGEEVVGAKQNRIINTTILIAPGTSARIPVSCVERDRWSWKSRHFGTEKRLSPARLRKRTSSSVTDSARHGDDTFVSDQHGIWEEISCCFIRTGTSSPTSEMGAIYRENSKKLTDYEQAFKPVDRQVGAVFAVNGKVAGLDSFISHEVLKKLFPKIVQSYAFDALLSQPGARDGHVKRTRVNDFLKNIGHAQKDAINSVGLGHDVRIESPSISGHALVAEEQVYHLSIFDNSDSEDMPGPADIWMH